MGIFEYIFPAVNSYRETCRKRLRRSGNPAPEESADMKFELRNFDWLLSTRPSQISLVARRRVGRDREFKFNHAAFAVPQRLPIREVALLAFESNQSSRFLIKPRGVPLSLSPSRFPVILQNRICEMSFVLPLILLVIHYYCPFHCHTRI